VTVDWFVLLTPVVLLIVALPFLFVGCSKFDAAPAGPTTIAGPPLGIAPPDPPQTFFRLEMDANLNQGFNSPVVKIEVTWSLESAAGTAPPIVLPQQPPAVITSKQIPLPVPPKIDPLKDPGASDSILSSTVGTRDRVRCICKVILNNSNTPTVFGNNDQAALVKDRVHEFRIKSRDPAGGLQVYFNGA
jgi:hypothetical protein